MRQFLLLLILCCCVSGCHGCGGHHALSLPSGGFGSGGGGYTSPGAYDPDEQRRHGYVQSAQ